MDHEPSVAAIFAGAGVAALVAALQELVFHGWLLWRLGERWGRAQALAITGVAFVAIHLDRPGETTAGLIGLFLFAVAAGAGALRAGGVAWAIGFHFAWNLLQGPLLGLPDSGATPAASALAGRTAGPAWVSGGTAGLEGGAPALVIFLVLAIWLLRPSPRARSGANR